VRSSILVKRCNYATSILANAYTVQAWRTVSSYHGVYKNGRSYVVFDALINCTLPEPQLSLRSYLSKCSLLPSSLLRPLWPLLRARVCARNTLLIPAAPTQSTTTLGDKIRAVGPNVPMSTMCRALEHHSTLYVRVAIGLSMFVIQLTLWLKTWQWSGNSNAVKSYPNVRLVTVLLSLPPRY
jgi:hypothetical protein